MAECCGDETCAGGAAVILYFLGGEEVKHRANAPIYERALKETGFGKVSLILWTTKDRDRALKYEEILRSYFNDLGASDVSAIYYWDGRHEIMEKLKNSALLYFPGGLPELFLGKAFEIRFLEMVPKTVNVIIGNSAGALVLTRDCIITKDEAHPKTEIVKGLGFVDFSVEVHYEGSRDQELLELSVGRKIYAIPENHVLRYDSRTHEFRGFYKFYLFENGRKSKFDGN